MTNSEIKQWAKEKREGNIWKILSAMIIVGILTNLQIGGHTYEVEDYSYTVSYSVGWLFYFVQVGLTYYMVKFITDKKTEYSDLFHFFNDFGRTLLASLLQGLFVILWSFLFIIPGIIKAYAYSLVSMILADDKYHDMGARDVLKLSEEMMNGHKADFFWLQFSFIGWHLLAILTLGILEIWIAPYQKIAETKFLYEVKRNYEKAHGTAEAEVEEKETKEEKKETKKEVSTKFCPECGTKASKEDTFCRECGASLS